MRSLIVLAVIAAVVVGCDCTAPSSDPSAGDAVQSGGWPDDPQRIVSMAPNTTELLFELGLGDRVVGVTRYCDWPAQTDEIDSIGGMLDPDFEAIVAAEPDVVVGTTDGADAAVEDRLETAGLDYGFVPVDDIDSVRAAIEQFGDWFGVADHARQLHRDFDAELDRAGSDAAGGTDGAGALMVLDTDPVIAAGPGSLGDELMAHAGLDNVLGGQVDDYPMLDAEQILQLDPEVIIFTDIAADGDEPEAFDELDAPRVVHIEDPVVLRPGPRIPEAVELLVQRLESP